jgi:hypothetical protein
MTIDKITVLHTTYSHHTKTAIKLKISLSQVLKVKIDTAINIKHHTKAAIKLLILNPELIVSST